MAFLDRLNFIEIGNLRPLQTEALQNRGQHFTNFDPRHPGRRVRMGFVITERHRSDGLKLGVNEKRSAGLLRQSPVMVYFVRR